MKLINLGEGDRVIDVARVMTKDDEEEGEGEEGAEYPWRPPISDEEKTMGRRHHTKVVHEGDYVAEVDVDLVDPDEGWSPYLSLGDAQKLDVVRDALREGDLKGASRLGRVFTLKPVAL